MMEIRKNPPRYRMASPKTPGWPFGPMEGPFPREVKITIFSFYKILNDQKPEPHVHPIGHFPNNPITFPYQSGTHQQQVHNLPIFPCPVPHAKVKGVEVRLLSYVE